MKSGLDLRRPSRPALLRALLRALVLAALLVVGVIRAERGAANRAPDPRCVVGDGVVLNEIRGQGGVDFIELFNRSDRAVDLSGYGVSDGTNTFVFPTDTCVPALGYLFVQRRGDGCVVAEGCFFITWGVSALGETILLIDAAEATVDATTYPDEDSPSGLDNGETWGRLPNGSGSFQATVATAGAANRVR